MPAAALFWASQVWGDEPNSCTIDAKAYIEYPSECLQLPCFGPARSGEHIRIRKQYEPNSCTIDAKAYISSCRPCHDRYRIMSGCRFSILVGGGRSSSVVPAYWAVVLTCTSQYYNNNSYSTASAHIIIQGFSNTDIIMKTICKFFYLLHISLHNTF